jgi:hypothetical protein
MTDYRAYSVNNKDHIESPPTIITCVGDEEAIEEAKQLKWDLDIELWQESRFVARIGSAQSHHAPPENKPQQAK